MLVYFTDILVTLVTFRLIILYILYNTTVQMSKSNFKKLK